MLKRPFITLCILAVCIALHAQSVTDTAFEAVLAQISYPYSTLSTPNGEVDSAKVYSFMDRYDPVYGQRNAYRLALAQVVHRLRLTSEDNCFLYDSLLLVLPDYLLENNPSDLYNKLQTGKILPQDTALQIVHMLYQASPSQLKEWLQNCFWQQYYPLPTPAEFAASLEKAHAMGISTRRLQQLLHNVTAAIPGFTDSLLEKMNRDTSLHDLVYPMALWRHLHDHPADQPLQAATVAAFNALDAACSRTGNAQRYALASYQLLQSQHAGILADTLLTRTIRRLQQETDDMTNADRHAARSLLAYAWYICYQAAKDKDPNRALEYLATAARLSPSNASEKAYASFYDRALLGADAKESYRDEFAKTLLEKGDDKTAMRILAEQITATPEQAYALKALFESKFPGGNFPGFFDTHVMGTWKMAPGFKLRTPDGKLHQLDDYKGKWLLLDFWGTWCSPCRQELPAINAFAASVADSPTQAFLSIDCQDTELSLTGFLHDNKYTFPLVISDRQVEMDYAVTGYPTKVLVAPNGRMLQLSFGAPWQSILAQFIAIQATPPPPAPAPPHLPAPPGR